MKKVLVTGASGFVGSRFVHRWKDRYKIIAPTHAEMDISDTASVNMFTRESAPDVILHLAALSNTWYCEQHPDESYRINVKGSENLAEAARLCGAKFIFFSSDQIYNSNQETGLLNEDTPVAPENVYGQHKLEAEQRILSTLPESVLLRATWMYDAPRDGLPKHADFVQNIIDATVKGAQLRMPVREYRGITWVREVVEFLPHTFSLQGGVYNFGSENRMNTYETACCYCEMLETSIGTSAIILPDYERYPNHERNLSISTNKIFRASGGRICFANTIDGLRLFLDITKHRWEKP